MSSTSTKRRAFGLVEAFQVFALWNLAAAQPLYDLLGANSEFFAVRGSRGADVLAWVFLLSLLAPLVLVSLTAVASAISRPFGTALHSGLVSLLTAALVLVVTQRLQWPPLLLVFVAVLVGLIAAVALGRYRPLRQYLAILAVGAVVFPVLFLAGSSVLHATSRRSVGIVDLPAVEAAFPVVMVVFDELPTLSLMDVDRNIDAVRYPNLASLADQATWYRYAATVSEFTTTAVPAIVTGMYPKPGLQPIAADHPFNLFTLLGGSFDLSVVESMSHLCPAELCDESEESFVQRLSSLVADTSIVYGHLVLPEIWSGFLPPVDQTWMEFGAEERLDEDAQKRFDSHWLEIFRDRAYGDRAADLLQYLAGIGTDVKPHLYYYNSFLAHVPFDYLPSGHLYSADREVKGRVVGEEWGGDEWAVTQSYQRHLLQVGFVDRQVGQIVRRLRATGLFDSCLLIVTADHGASHRPHDSRRRMTETNYADIVLVPLLIKLPNQQTGRVDDRVARTIDIVPTVAELLGIELPWAIDGVSLLGPATEAQDAYLVYHQDEAVPVSFRPEVMREALDEALQTKLAIFGSGADPEERFYQVGTYGELVGRRVAALSIGQVGDVESEVFPSSHLATFDPDGGFVPSHIRGRARLSQVGRPINLAVAVNGTIRATTRTWSFSTNKGWDEWSAVVNEASFRPGKNEIEVFHIRRSGSEVELERTANKILSPADGSAPLGVEPVFGVEESGFHSPQRFGDIPARWTDGHARLSIPVDSDNLPESLRVDLLWTGPNGTELQVLLQGKVVFEDRLPDGRWSYAFDLTDLDLGNRIELELASDTFVPRDTIEGNEDPRTLGVAVGGVWLLEG